MEYQCEWKALIIQEEWSEQETDKLQDKNQPIGKGQLGSKGKGFFSSNLIERGFDPVRECPAEGEKKGKGHDEQAIKKARI